MIPNQQQDARIRPREITVITKTEPARPSTWEKVERVLHALSIFAIPVVLAVGGWVVQHQLQNQTVKRDYVQLAVTILQAPEQTKVKPELRAWAAQLLSAYSPIPIDADTLAKLKSGQTTLPPWDLCKLPADQRPFYCELGKVREPPTTNRR
jgi:hypothetical protein